MTLSRKPLKIGVFGTASDPPHLGHLALVKCAKRYLDLDRVIVIPTKIPPHKAAPLTAPEIRLQIARRLFSSTPGVEVSDIEIKRDGVSYTKDTIAELKKKYPHDKLFWIISLETLVNMPREWRDGYGILDFCAFAVLMRKGYESAKIPAHVLSKIIMIKGCRPPKISSTKIRKLLETQKNVSSLVGKKVYKFISQHELYGKD